MLDILKWFLAEPLIVELDPVIVTIKRVTDIMSPISMLTNMLNNREQPVSPLTTGLTSLLEHS